jgi:hypothetical protein
MTLAGLLSISPYPAKPKDDFAQKSRVTLIFDV